MILSRIKTLGVTVMTIAHFVWLGLRRCMVMCLLGIAIVTAFWLIGGTNRLDMLAIGVGTIAAIWIVGSVAMVTSMLLLHVLFGSLSIRDYRSVSTFHEAKAVNARNWERFWHHEK